METFTTDICENAAICGGCAYQGTPYGEQLAAKEKLVRGLIDEVVKTPYIFESIIPSPFSQRYRNKMEFSFGDCRKDGPLTLGLHQKKSFFNIINTDHCQLTHPDFGVILESTRTYFAALGLPYKHKKSHRGYLRHLLVRRAIKTGEILVDLVTTTQTEYLESEETRQRAIAEWNQNGDGALAASCGCETMETLILRGWMLRLLRLKAEGKIEGNFAGILHTSNDSRADAIVNDGTEILYGQDCFYEELLGLRFRITPFSFFQTNSLGAEKLYEKAREYAGMSDDTTPENRPVIYDLYCGTGTISQIMSPAASQVVGVEIVKEAVAAARENAALNKIQNCDFIAGDVLKVISDGGELIREDGSIEDAPRPDLIILDPPRDGIHAKALAKIIDYGVDHIVYISCKPQSLARDLVPLQAAGYQVEKVCPVDMFPFTQNVETVVLLSKLNAKQHIDVELNLDELDLTAAKSKATYEEIKE